MTVAGWVRTAPGRLPLRVRLIAGFVVAVGVVLTGAGSFVYWRVAYALDRRLDSDLRDEASTLAPLVGEQGKVVLDPGLARSPGARLFQVVDAHGRILDEGSDMGPAPLLSPQQVAAASRAETFADVGALLPASRRPLRLLAVPLPGPGPAQVLVVAQRRDQRDEALRELLAQLALAGLGALAVTAVVGDVLARAALSPVERYRVRAARITSGVKGVRLDVPAGRDDEVTRLGHTLNDMLDALEAALEREQRFVQDASHELRTPLTILSTRVQATLRRPRTVAEHEAVLHELGEDVAALAALAESLLAVGAARHLAEGQGSDLAEAAREVARTRPGVSVEVPSASLGELVVPMDETSARRVVAGLLDNALLHGSAPIQVVVKGVGDVLVLEVRDQGPGISPGFLPYAAQRFARADTARARPGAGLGLSLVDALVQAVGGDLRLCSAGAHHRFSTHVSDRIDVHCDHPTSGTTASVLLPGK